MKLGELFYAIGIDVDDEKLDSFDKKLADAKKNVLLFVAELTGALYAMDRFVDSSVRGAVALANFAMQTGLSTQRLQQWQYAAGLSNIALSADDAASSIKALQDNLTSIRMGAGNAAPFQLLGIDINGKDAFDVLEQVRDRIKDIDPSVASNLIKQMGLNEGFINVLRLSREEFEKLGKGLSRSSATLDALSRIGKSVRLLKENFKLFKDGLVVDLEPVWNKVIDGLYLGLRLFQSLSTAVGMLTHVWDNFSDATKEWIKVFGAGLLVVLAPIRAMLLGILLLIDDFVAYKKGGKSVIGAIMARLGGGKAGVDKARDAVGLPPDEEAKPDDTLHDRLERFNRDGAKKLKQVMEEDRQKRADKKAGKSASDGALPNTPLPGDRDVYYPPQPNIPPGYGETSLDDLLKNYDPSNPLPRIKDAAAGSLGFKEHLMKGGNTVEQNNTFHIQGGDPESIADAVASKTQTQLNHSLADTGNARVLLMSLFDSSTNALDVFDNVKSVFDKYIVRPANAFGLGGFVFDVEGETNITISTDITDHYTEANEAIQDHIAVKPKKIMLKSYVGELVYRTDESTDGLLQKTVRKLNIINSYLPALSRAGTQLKEILDGQQADLSFNNILNNASDLWSLTKNLNPPIPRQQQAYMYFKALAETKQILAVQTPFEYANSMAIETIVAVQAEGSRWISDFSITLKEIRFAKAKISQTDFFTKDNMQGRTAEQRSPVANQGQTPGSTPDQSLDSTLARWFL